MDGKLRQGIRDRFLEGMSHAACTVNMVSKVSSDLQLQPHISTLSGMNPSVPADMRIVIGKDFLGSLQ